VTSRPKKVAFTSLRLVLGAVFVWAALAKMLDVHGFADEITRYQLLPVAMAPAFAVLLIGTELAAGVSLLTGLATRLGAAVVAILLIGFIIALSQALLRHLDLSCGCFGGAEPASISTVARDAVLLFGCVPLLFSKRFSVGRAPTLKRPVRWRVASPGGARELEAAADPAAAEHPLEGTHV
jgi:putative oxidoreductase